MSSLLVGPLSARSSWCRNLLDTKIANGKNTVSFTLRRLSSSRSYDRGRAMSAWTQLLEPGPALFLLIALLVPQAAVAAPYEQTTDIEYYPVADSTGCYYNFQHYDEGDRIITNEPCLNCTCHNRMLMCYLRVCPFTKAIGQDCKVEKRSDQCCPVITCPEVPVALQPSSTQSSTAVGHLDAYGCSIDGLFYGDGARVPSEPNKPCELCYCIRNKTACVMQQCTLEVEGCKPVYQEGVCCPVRYNCEHPEYDLLETTTRRLITTTTVEPTTRTPDCTFNNEIYGDGSLISSDNKCERCYCMKGDIVCAVQKCNPTPLDKVNCTAIPPKDGQCCPDSYQCDHMVEEELTTGYPDTTPSVKFEETTSHPKEETKTEQEQVTTTSPLAPETTPHASLTPSYDGKEEEEEQEEKQVTTQSSPVDKETPEVAEKFDHEEPQKMTVTPFFDEQAPVTEEIEKESEKPEEYPHETTVKPEEHPYETTVKPEEPKLPEQEVNEIPQEPESHTDRYPTQEGSGQEPELTEAELPEVTEAELPEVTEKTTEPSVDGKVTQPEEVSHVEKEVPAVTEPITHEEPKVTEAPAKPESTEPSVQVTSTSEHIPSIPKEHVTTEAVVTEEPHVVQQVTETAPEIGTGLPHEMETGKPEVSTELPGKVEKEGETTPTEVYQVPVTQGPSGHIPKGENEIPEEEEEHVSIYDHAEVSPEAEVTTPKLGATEIPETVSERVTEGVEVPKGTEQPTEVPQQPSVGEEGTTQMPSKHLDEVTTETEEHVTEHKEPEAPKEEEHTKAPTEVSTEVPKEHTTSVKGLEEVTIGQVEVTEQVHVTEIIEGEGESTKAPEGQTVKPEGESTTSPKYEVTATESEGTKQTEEPIVHVTDIPREETTKYVKEGEIPEEHVTVKAIEKETELPAQPITTEGYKTSKTSTEAEIVTELPIKPTEGIEQITEQPAAVTESQKEGEIEKETELPKEHIPEIPKETEAPLEQVTEKATSKPAEEVPYTIVPEEVTQHTTAKVAEEGHATEIPSIGETTPVIISEEVTTAEHVPHKDEEATVKPTEEIPHITQPTAEQTTIGKVEEEKGTEVPELPEGVQRTELPGKEIVTSTPEEEVKPEDHTIVTSKPEGESKATELPESHVTEIATEAHTKPSEISTELPIEKETEKQEPVTEPHITQQPEHSTEGKLEETTKYVEEAETSEHYPEHDHVPQLPEEPETGEPAAETEKPVGEIEKPEAETEKPVGETEKPGAATEKPVGETETPGAETEKPVGETEKPGAATEKPVGQTEKPGAATEKPVGETETPGAETEKPVGETEKPGAETEIPVGETEKPVAATEIPVGETEKPGAETEKPLGETEKPGAETEKPVGETEKPGAATEIPVGETEKPAAETEKPVAETEKPQEITQKPTTGEEEIHVTEISTEKEEEGKTEIPTEKPIDVTKAPEYPEHVTHVPTEEQKETEGEITEKPQEPELATTQKATEKPQEITEGAVTEKTLEEHTVKPVEIQPETTVRISEEVTTAVSAEKEGEPAEVTTAKSEEGERGIPGEGSCLVDGQTYTNNSEIPPINPCQVSCKCVSSIVQCRSIECSAPPAHLQHCMPVYSGPDSCCPTYSCAIPGVTSMESDSHKMEATTTETIPDVTVIIPSQEGTIRPESTTAGRDSTELPEFTLPEQVPHKTEKPEHITEIPEEVTQPQIIETTSKPISEAHTVLPFVPTTEREGEQTTGELMTSKPEPEQPITEKVPEITTLKAIVPTEEEPEVGTVPSDEENVIDDHVTVSYVPQAPEVPELTTPETEIGGITTKPGAETTEHVPSEVVTEAHITSTSEPVKGETVVTEHIPVTEGKPSDEEITEGPKGTSEAPIAVTDIVQPEIVTEHEGVKEVETVKPTEISEPATEPSVVGVTEPKVPVVTEEEKIVTTQTPEKEEPIVPTGAPGTEQPEQPIATEGTPEKETEIPVVVTEQIATEKIPEIESHMTEKPEPEHVPSHDESATTEQPEIPGKVSTEEVPTEEGKPTESVPEITKQPSGEGEATTIKSIIPEKEPEYIPTEKTEDITKPAEHVTEPGIVTEQPAAEGSTAKIIPEKTPSGEEITTAHPVYVPEITTTPKEVPETTELEKEITTAGYIPEKEEATKEPKPATESTSEPGKITEIPEEITTAKHIELPTTVPSTYVSETTKVPEELPQTSKSTEAEEHITTEVPEKVPETTEKEHAVTYPEKDETTIGVEIITPVRGLPETTEQPEKEHTTLPEKVEPEVTILPETLPEVTVAPEQLPETTEKGEAVTTPEKEGTTAPVEIVTPVRGLPETTEPTEKEHTTPSEKFEPEVTITPETLPGITTPSEKLPEGTTAPETLPEVTIAPETSPVPTETGEVVTHPEEKETTAPVEIVTPTHVLPETTEETEKGETSPELSEKDKTTTTTKRPFIYIPPVNDTEIPAYGEKEGTTPTAEIATKQPEKEVPGTTVSELEASKVTVVPSEGEVTEPFVTVTAVPAEKESTEKAIPEVQTEVPLGTQPPKEAVTEGVEIVTAQPATTEKEHETEKPMEEGVTEARPTIPGEGQEPTATEKPEDVFTSPITFTPITSSTELFTSGPTQEFTTKKSIPGELSTSKPFTTTTVSQLPEEEYQTPVEEEEYDEQGSFGPGTCRYGGKVYVSAQQIPRDDPCDFCFCFRSDIICLQQSCPPPIPHCHEEPIRGFCCPRYECPVSMATSVNITTTTTTTTTTLPPHFLAHAYKGRARRSGCQIQNKAYRVGEVIESSSGPCLHCTCGGNGQMQCDPKPCSPEPMLRQMIAAAESSRRR